MQYICNYRGYAYYYRLIFVAIRYEQLRGEALKLAANYIKDKTYDIVSYTKIFDILNQTARSAFITSGQEIDETELSNKLLQAVMCGENVAQISYDKNWIENTRRSSTFKLEQLDTDLKNYLANSIKDSVRRVSDEMGNFYLQMGNFDKSLKCYLRSRDNCTSSFQELLSCINIIKIYIYQESWPFVNANFAKGDSLIDSKDSVINRADPDSNYNNNPGYITNSGLLNNNKEAYSIAKSQLAIAGGLYQLSLGKYRIAALYFVQISGDYQESYNDILSTTDIINYASLCALASMERNEIGRFVTGSGNKTKAGSGFLNFSLIHNFKQLLESEPKCRDMLKSFYIADYSTCLRILEKMCLETLYLDCYLAHHLGRLVAEIRNKALCQYFSPYLSADLLTMSEKFNTTLDGIQTELTYLIQSGKMKARIDSARGLLKALSVDQRRSSIAQALNYADEYYFNAQKALIRMAIARNKLSVEPDTLNTNNNDEDDHHDNNGNKNKSLRPMAKRSSLLPTTVSPSPVAPMANNYVAGSTNQLPQQGTSMDQDFF